LRSITLRWTSTAQRRASTTLANSAWRAAVVRDGRPEPDATAPTADTRPRGAWTWAALMHRVFALDVLACPRCGGRPQVIAIVQDPAVVQTLLAHGRGARRAVFANCEAGQALTPRGRPPGTSTPGKSPRGHRPSVAARPVSSAALLDSAQNRSP
jgi:hypothetical protein